jgi:hypothetical protein
MLLALGVENGARAIRRDVPPGLLVPSAVALNIHSVREVARLASEMVDELSGRGATASVLLPDLSVVSAVFPPSQGAAERDLGSKLASRFGFPASEARSDFWRGGKGEVLAAAVREAVVRQYEQVVEAAECRPMIDAEPRSPSGGRPSPTRERSLVEALPISITTPWCFFMEELDVRRGSARDDVEAVAAEIRCLPAI